MTTARKLDEKYTYSDYLNWPQDERWELIEGTPYDMSPAPGTQHQAVSFELSRILGNFLKNTDCRAFTAPFDVRLPGEKENSDANTDTVVQPDIVVICDKTKIDEKGCCGAPDIVIEILSASTSYKDEGEKLKLYEKHSVKEYWIVNPASRYVMIYHLEDSKFSKPEYLRNDEVLTSRILQGFSLNLDEIWPED